MNESKPIKNFKNIIEEVHDKGICQMCGGCVSFCSSADYKVIDFIDPNLPPQFIHEDKCLECGICYHICPQTHVLVSDLNNQYNYVEPIGDFFGIFSCQALDEDLLRNGTDGGVVSALLLFLIERRLVDGAIVSRKVGPFSRDSMIAKTKDDLVAAQGSILDVAPQVTEIANYTTYSPTISALNRYKFKKLAIVGTPCQLYTMRCMQNLGVTPSQNIEICLGLFCYENFSFQQFKKEKFESDFNIKFEDIKKVNIKEDLFFTLKDDKIVHIPFSEIKEYMRQACNACDDFSNIYADISFGGLGSPEKYTTVIPRTQKGIDLFSKAVEAEYIRVLELDKVEKAKRKELIIKFSQQKKARRQDFIQNLI